MMNNEKDAIDTSKLDEILPKYDPLKLNSINLAQNYVSAFNTGMNIYQCVNQLQGYIEWVVKAVNDVVKSWNVQVGESIDQSKAIVRETTTEQFNTEWTNKQPELIEQVNTLTTNQFNEDWGVLENRINTTLETQNTKINSIQTQQTNLANQQTTLSQRMDTFTSLEEGSTTGDAELQDIRVGANGTTYDTAGNAVRGQYSQLKEDIDDNRNISLDVYDLFNKKTNVLNECEVFTQNIYIPSVGITTRDGYMTYRLSVVNNEIYFINAENYNLDDVVIITDKNEKTLVTYSMVNNKYIVIPHNGVKMYINRSWRNSVEPSLFKCEIKGVDYCFKDLYGYEENATVLNVSNVDYVPGGIMGIQGNPSVFRSYAGRDEGTMFRAYFAKEIDSKILNVTSLESDGLHLYVSGNNIKNLKKGSILNMMDVADLKYIGRKGQTITYENDNGETRTIPRLISSIVETVDYNNGYITIKDGWYAYGSSEKIIPVELWYYKTIIFDSPTTGWVSNDVGTIPNNSTTRNIIVTEVDTRNFAYIEDSEVNSDTSADGISVVNMGGRQTYGYNFACSPSIEGANSDNTFTYYGYMCEKANVGFYGKGNKEYDFANNGIFKVRSNGHFDGLGWNITIVENNSVIDTRNYINVLNGVTVNLPTENIQNGASLKFVCPPTALESTINGDVYNGNELVNRLILKSGQYIELIYIDKWCKFESI